MRELPLGSGLRRLTVAERTVIVLHHYLDLPHEETARILGVAEGTARSRLSRALQALRAALEAEGRVDVGELGAAENV